VLQASPDRVEAPCPYYGVCGGCHWQHIRYERQLQLKADVVSDAFRRIGRMTLPGAVRVAPSPERGYRLRARLHVVGRRAVFFREGTHQPCDAGATGQLTADTIAAIDGTTRVLAPRLADCEAIDVAENIAATERVLHVGARAGARFEDLSRRIDLPDGVSGITTSGRGRPLTLAGQPAVTDTAQDLFGGASPIGDLAVWTRHASSFFQGNRFLTGDLVRRVLAVSEAGRAIDLYAGVGLFAVALAARGVEVVAVEGDRSSAADLVANARPWSGRLHVVRSAVEDVVGDRPDPPPDTVVLDPPRSGASAEALAGVLAWRAPRIVYVSCDAPTLARDAARLAGGGYALTSIDGFDLFPNTPHVESVAVFDLQG
jgi:23S rRNA (uracil1939-C5)-methyltransferase